MKLAIALLLLPGLALANPDPAPKPSADLAELAAMMDGTWKCTGKALDDDGKTWVKGSFTITSKLDLDKWWVASTSAGTFGAYAVKSSSFTGYNAADKKFYRYGVDNQGDFVTSTAISVDHGMNDKAAIHWDSEVKSGVPLPASTKSNAKSYKARSTEAYARAGLAIMNEVSIDGGKSWIDTGELTCKK